MVRERRGKRMLYVCDSCGFAYADRKTAAACEEHCEKYKTCSLEITKKAVPLE